MGSVKTELMQFKVTPEERALIEKCAKKEKTTVSEYAPAATSNSSICGRVKFPYLSGGTGGV